MKMTLIFSDTTGEVLSTPKEEKREEHESSFIVVRYYQDDSGWRFSIQLKLKRLIRCKSCLQSDQPMQSKTAAVLAAEKTVYSWLSKPQRKQFAAFSVFDFEQPSLFPELD
jgi:hypothetical protein